MESRPNLRFEFVEMLFALAIGQVAMEIGDLVLADISILYYPHVYSQLILGTLIITLSWIGWQNSKSTGNTQIIDSIFSFQFIILLIDIFLVVCYFIIVKGAEIPKDKTTNIRLDVYNESFWSVIIFGVYLIWDMFTKLLDIDFSSNGAKYQKKRKYDKKAFLKRVWQTIICLLLTIGVYKFMNKATSVWHVVLVDMTLISIFILFRGLKQKIKKDEFVDKAQLPKSKQISLGLADSQYPITVTENNYSTKIFCAWILPAILIVGFYLIYHFLP